MKLAEWKRPHLYGLQEGALFGPERFAAIEGGTKSGKTVGSISWLLEQACLIGPGNYTWTAPVSEQSKIAWRRIKKGVPRRIVLSAPVSPYPRVNLANGASVLFQSGDKPDSLYGEDVNAAVVDEASRCQEEAWHAVYSTLTATQGQARLIGNVHGRGWFYKLCRRAESGQPDWSYSKITWHDAVAAGVLAQSVIDAARADLPRHRFEELYECKAAGDGTNPFGFDAIAKATRHVLSLKEPVAWGWDLAKSVDWTVGIGLDTDGAIARIERWQLVPWEATVRRIRTLTRQVPAYVDATGVGDPILERLRKAAPNFEGFIFTERSRAQLVEGLAAAVQHSDASLYDGGKAGAQLVKEMEDMQIVDVNGKPKYRVPDGQHDDCLFAMALAVRRLTQPTATWGSV